MYTILVNDDNALQTSIRTRIMQNSKNVDELHFLVKPNYNEIDMTDLTVVLTYILPISKERKTLTLTKSEDLYKERLEYKILLDNDENFITSEVGDIKMWLTFMRDDETVRYTTPIILSVHSTEESTVNPSEPTQTPTVDNIFLDKDTNQIYLTSGGTAVGAAIPINDLGNAIVESSSEGLITMITD
jgi:hypothetical protein